MKQAASVECARNGVIVVSDRDFVSEADRCACVLSAAIGIGLAAGMDSGEIIRQVHEILDRAIEYNAEALEAIRRGSPGGCDGIGMG